MYAKLFSRITESSLMEEPIPVRYAFVILLSIADAQGYVIGTDVALARRMNMPLPEFEVAIKALMSPDPDSNSKEEEGRRVVESDTERGYKIVNYVTYRDAKDADSRREYMREYMRKRRSPKQLQNVSRRKQPLALLGHADADADADAEKTAAKAAGRGAGAPPTVNLSDEDWLKSLRENEAYADIDIGREEAKMRAWCQVHGKQPTRKRFVNWLNRVDKPLDGGLPGLINGRSNEETRPGYRDIT